MLALTGCSSAPSEQTDNYYKFDRSGITEISATSQMADQVKKIVISKEDAQAFLDKVEQLRLTPADTENDAKGWDYFFVIKYDSGKETQISFLKEIIKIDDEAYKSDLYKSETFLTYFE